MNVSLYQAASALNANSRWQEVISENLAASSIPGYKKQELSFAAVAEATSPLTLSKTTAVTNFQSGDLKFTGVSTDIAIEGRGFIPVQLPDGNTAYTRDGEFHLNATGQLVTKQGFLVQGQGGPIQLDINNKAPVSISASGEVSQGADSKGTIKPVDFNDLKLLTPISNGMFLANHPALQQLEPTDTTLRQGFLESSNVASSLEMVNLISAMRIYEANQKVIQVQDERLGRTISELGNPN